jgi:hypothetical protein
MNARWLLPLCFFLIGSCVAWQSAQELQSRAESANGGECVHVNLRLARQHLADADHRFSDSDLAPARAAVDAALHDVSRAVECSLQVRRSQKSAEIELRELSRRMTALLHTLDSEQRPYLARAQSELEKQHDRLLHAIFGDAMGPVAEKKP